MSRSWAYLSERSGTYLRVIDISDPTSLRETSLVEVNPDQLSIDTYMGKSAIRDDLIFVTNGNLDIVRFDTSVPSGDAGDFSRTNIAVDGGAVNSVVVAGDYAYLAAGAAGLAVVRAATLQTAALLNTYPTVGQAKDLAVYGDHLFVLDTSTSSTNTNDSVCVYSIASDPSDPSFVRRI